MDGEGEPGFSRYFWKLLQDPNSDSLEQKSVMRGEGCSLPCSRIYFPLRRFIPGSPNQIAGGLLCLCFFPGNELFFLFAWLVSSLQVQRSLACGEYAHRERCAGHASMRGEGRGAAAPPPSPIPQPGALWGCWGAPTHGQRPTCRGEGP